MDDDEHRPSSSDRSAATARERRMWATDMTRRGGAIGRSGAAVIAGVLLAMALAGCGIGLPYGSPPPENDGKVVSFTPKIAGLLGADYKKCPQPVVVRQRSDDGGPPWDLWAEFTVTDDAQAEQVVNECLQLRNKYSPEKWIHDTAPLPYRWGNSGGFVNFDLAPKSSDIQTLAVDDDLSAKVGRSVEVARHVNEEQPFRVDVLRNQVS